MSGNRVRRRPTFRAARDAATAVEFAYIAPILVVVAFGLIEMGWILFDFHRAGEAMRQAARALEVTPALNSFDSFPVTCPSDAACNGQVNAVYDSIKSVLPQLTPANLEVVYDQSNLPVTSGVVTPVVTVRLVNLQHQFFILSSIIPGVPDGFTFPDFSTSRVTQSEVQTPAGE